MRALLIKFFLQVSRIANVAIFTPKYKARLAFQGVPVANK